MNSQMRWDTIHGRWCLYSEKRMRRPQEPDIQPGMCPFCPGHEHQTPPPVYIDRDRGVSTATWRVRVVPNLYGFLDPQSHPGKLRHAPHLSRSSFGRHEIIIENPHHERHPGAYTDEEVFAVLLAYRSRLRALRNDPRIACVLVFKNHGAAAGASLAHGHSQLAALQVVPPALTIECHTPANCRYCKMVRGEAGGSRSVMAESGFLAMCPWASSQPYETWILPMNHQSDFADLDDGPLRAVARILRRVYEAFEKAMGDPPFNLILHSAPWRGNKYRFHWHIEVIPRTSQIAGFELGSGCFVNTLAPEQAAAALREWIERPHA